ncbi:hypothetical protein BWI17_16615 [Betaproteobacteria bacterium GR16-43]|nr:hypothetical protein BWI17_16615 [Betaproteobacteria bacterium GR16-43]
MDIPQYILDQLQARLAEVNEEIRRYPQPIARCDVQLGGLHEDRARLNEALRWIEEKRVS